MKYGKIETNKKYLRTHIGTAIVESEGGSPVKVDMSIGSVTSAPILYFKCGPQDRYFVLGWEDIIQLAIDSGVLVDAVIRGLSVTDEVIPGQIRLEVGHEEDY